MSVGVQDSVETVDSRGYGLGMEIGAGVDDDVVALPGDEDRRPGAAVAGRGAGRPGADETAERQTAQSQPSVGTPIEVPVPRKVRVACIGR